MKAAGVTGRVLANLSGKSRLPRIPSLNSFYRPYQGYVPSGAGRGIVSIPGGMDVRYRASRYLSASGRLASGLSARALNAPGVLTGSN